MEQRVMSAAVLPILILGLGWTGQFLTELMLSMQMDYAATTRDGRNDTIAWTLPDNCASLNVSSLPFAQTVLVTFPVKQPQCLDALIDAYEAQHEQSSQWILLSSTRPFSGNPADRHTPLDRSKDTGRMSAEDTLIQRGGSVLHLAGLWGNQRQPKNWVPRFSTAEAIRNKLLQRQLHLIHGKDVARAILAVHQQFKPGERWIITDQTCYDWIKLFLAWGSEEQIQIARDLAIHDDQCRQALGDGSLEEVVARGEVKPRLDSTEFWETFHLKPTEFLSV
ncbi:hypothetical protein G6F70_003885 [Rhizopus microsporus]|uniref:NAD(P)-binding domain-containing protein n=2 Tax=Rhizopus TaxID=4842 RepID=A0A367JDC6_RHIAZ|nr:hypothetical protein G6F71_003884 [Rhizopus microsporus]RCH87948.1 hypothetical protein CU097_008788 [Rhizopus azygosporus]KAG1200645.1 hypothetical protein G6F70_003885 [Rhizopus microsporus]KAG1216447.1 hypothetical protein G6F69_000018 [Rhizopus microsporus]KAG1234424.1 hypothetical protein G6F67_003550 [Rhizopus microsporus]